MRFLERFDAALRARENGLLVSLTRALFSQMAAICQAASFARFGLNPIRIRSFLRILFLLDVGTVPW
jgi:hypothetical protein